MSEMTKPIGSFSLRTLTFANLTTLGIFHGITTRDWNSLNPFQGYDSPYRLNEGIQFYDGTSAATRVVYAEEVHKANVHWCSPSDAASIRLNCDALISGVGRLLLAIYIADCFPILIADKATGVVGVIHAGRKGTIAGVIQHTVQAMLNRNGQPNQLVVGIGPGLRSCCYSIREDIIPELEQVSWTPFINQREGILYLDLASACREALEGSGIPRHNIEDMGICTYCRSDLLFSARNRGDADERGASFAALISSSNGPC